MLRSSENRLMGESYESYRSYTAVTYLTTLYRRLFKQMGVQLSGDDASQVAVLTVKEANQLQDPSIQAELRALLPPHPGFKLNGNTLIVNTEALMQFIAAKMKAIYQAHALQADFQSSLSMKPQDPRFRFEQVRSLEVTEGIAFKELNEEPVDLGLEASGLNSVLHYNGFTFMNINNAALFFEAIKKLPQKAPLSPEAKASAQQALGLLWGARERSREKELSQRSEDKEWQLELLDNIRKSSPGKSGLQQLLLETTADDDLPLIWAEEEVPSNREAFFKKAKAEGRDQEGYYFYFPKNNDSALGMGIMRVVKGAGEYLESTHQLVLVKGRLMIKTGPELALQQGTLFSCLYDLIAHYRRATGKESLPGPGPEPILLAPRVTQRKP